MSEQPLAGLRLSLVGPGKVGSSVARWLLAAGVQMSAVVRRGGGRLPRWAAAAGARAVELDELASAGDDLLLVAVPDGALAAVAARLAAQPQAPVALHVSGLRTAEALAPLRAGATAVGGWHPLRSFPRALPSPALARKTFFAIQGDAPARELATRLSFALGAPHAEVPAAARALYHLAATWAAGGMVTLLGAAVDLHRHAGVSPAAAPGLVEMGRSALALADTASPVATLSGPVVRGEATYLEQLAALREAFPVVHPLAVLVGLEALRQLAERGPLDPSQEILRTALGAICERRDFLDPLRGQV